MKTISSLLPRLILCLFSTVAFSWVSQAQLPPKLSPISDQAISEDSATGPIKVTLSDPDTDPDFLVLTANSSNVVLVPNSNIILSGSGAERFVTIIPTANGVGQTTITVIVSDGSAKAATSF